MNSELVTFKRSIQAHLLKGINRNRSAAVATSNSYSQFRVLSLAKNLINRFGIYSVNRLMNTNIVLEGDAL